MENKLGIWAFRIKNHQTWGENTKKKNAFIVAEFENPLNFKLMSGHFELILMRKHIRQAFIVIEFENSLNFELISCHFKLNLMSSKLPYPFQIHEAYFKLTW